MRRPVAVERGNRHVCWQCGTGFYDLKRPEPKCPRCGMSPYAEPDVQEPFELVLHPTRWTLEMAPDGTPVPPEFFEEQGMKGDGKSWRRIVDAVVKANGDDKLVKRLTYECDAGRFRVSDTDKLTLVRIAHWVRLVWEDLEQLGATVQSIPKRYRK